MTTPEIKGFLLVAVVKMLVVFTAIMVGVIMVIWLERRGSAFLQDRRGPNRVGPYGLLQGLADGLKNMMKEETWPAQADKLIFLLAPTLAFIPSLLLFAVIPFASPLPPFDVTVHVLGLDFGRWVYTGPIQMAVADLPVGFLFIIAISSIAVYGIVLAGWSSNSKYAFLGGLRSSAQMISYEIALGMSLIVVLLLAGNVTLPAIVARQQVGIWYVFPAALGFLIFVISAFAETNRLPFDLPEAEAELVTGYHTEYSSMKFSLFFIAEYAAVITFSALMVTLFFGGWDIPFTKWDAAVPTAWNAEAILRVLATLVAFSLKTLVFVWIYIQVRWTLPRFRFDQLMNIGWKVLLPISLGYIGIMATAILIFHPLEAAHPKWFGAILFGINLPLLVAFVWGLDRGRIVVGEFQRARLEG
ncbi:MAG TPA: NADH-quinone oxidoreductase subunit NuoH [Gemmatimonadales bacterium]|nr:NADH-quinone oxidoreductase subunit NuoH [Gemmatimonadales bacterium]